MSRPVRLVDPDRYYLLTNRCLLGMFLLRPDAECRRIIQGCLARAADKHHVQLVCFVFLSNHFHLIARFPLMNMAAFMEEFQGQLARRINDHRDRSGTVFPERYDDQALLDDQVLKDKIAYVLNNPVKDQLAETAAEWPGVTSMHCHLQASNQLTGRWLDKSRRRKHKRRKATYEREEAMDTHTVDLHLPEALDGESDDERRRSLLALIGRNRRRCWLTSGGRADRPPSVPEPEEILQKDWWERPDEPPDHPWGKTRYLGVASTAEKMNDYHARRRDITRRYREALRAWRDRELKPFPHGTYPPGWRRCVGAPEHP